MRGTVIKGYQLTCDFRNDNSGFSRWAFARKDGVDVFIKEFLSPVYPVDPETLPEKIVKSRLKICEEYVETKNRLYNALNKCNTGNIVCVTDFFRYAAKYYIVTEKIQSDPLSIEEIADMTLEQKHLICKIIAHCVNTLHSNGIVHGDIKHENILFRKTPKGKYAAKIIDFDASFFEKDLPDPDEEFHGDMVYFAPESFLYIAEEVDSIDSKIDVFALGLLFHQYFTGHLPSFDTSEYEYPFEAVLDGNTLTVDSEVPEKYADIINKMLSSEPNDRPTLNEVFSSFGNVNEVVNTSDIKDINNEKTEESPKIGVKKPNNISYEENFGFHKAGDL